MTNPRQVYVGGLPFRIGEDEECGVLTERVTEEGTPDSSGEEGAELTPEKKQAKVIAKYFEEPCR